jgi:ubiquinone/menaquinone biosynthesis C-methylase UbiE
LCLDVFVVKTTADMSTDTINEWRENAKYWIKHSGTIRTMFAPVTSVLIEKAGIREGQSVLDIAGGAGEPSLTIAQTVGPTGSVMCTDAVAEMVEAAESEAHRQGLKNIQFQQCAADSLPFADNSFDAVVSRLGAMFFPDPLAAVREMLRVTKPDGVLAFVVWHQSQLNPFCYLVSNIMDQHVVSPAADPDAPNAFRFAEQGTLANVLVQAGAVNVEESEIDFDIEAPISAHEFWAMRSQTSDTLRVKLSQLSIEEQAQVGSEVEQAVAEFFPQNQMKFPARMILVKGHKPR